MFVSNETLNQLIMFERICEQVDALSLGESAIPLPIPRFSADLSDLYTSLEARQYRRVIESPELFSQLFWKVVAESEREGIQLEGCKLTVTKSPTHYKSVQMVLQEVAPLMLGNTYNSFFVKEETFSIDRFVFVPLSKELPFVLGYLSTLSESLGMRLAAEPLNTENEEVKSLRKYSFSPL